MTFYQELQLNQAGSKSLIKNCKTPKEKLHHLFIYIFKVFINVAFCVAFVTAYSMIFGNDNSIVGVVILLCILVFRNVDLGIHAPQSLLSLSAIFLILTFGPKAANLLGAFGGLLINFVCIWILMVLGCHNVIYYNHSTLVLGYLLLFGYDASGSAYTMRLFAMLFGFILTGVVFWRNHRKKTYKRGLRDLFNEFNLHSSRSRWQLLMASAVSSVIFIASILNLPRAMWAGIAAMSVLLPFRTDIKKHVCGRIPGNLLGGLIFFLIFPHLPVGLYSVVGIVGGIGVGFSASYGWQAVFNSLGAMMIAVSVIGFPQAVFFRIAQNIFGSLYALCFEKIFHTVTERKLESKI